MATMEITTTVGCSLACTFCPQDKLKGAYAKSAPRSMSMETFEKILDKVPEHVRINFSGLAEPWLNPNATDMLKMTLQKNRRVAIYTTLYGMTTQDSLSIKELFKEYAENIVLLCLHLPDKSKNMRGYRSSPEYRDVLTNILSIVDEGVYPARKLEVMAMDSTGKGQVHESLADIVDNLAPWRGHTRAGNIDEGLAEKIGATPTPHNDFSLYCGKTPFYDHNVVMPNGDVLLCCMDYSLQHVIGNILETDYWELFSSPALQKLRTLNQRPEFSAESPCKTCGTAVKAIPYYEPP